MTVAFRLTIYQADGVTADITVTSIRGGTNPYIVDVPTGDGQEVDLLTGAVRSGAYNVLVADVATGSNATGTIRVITNKLEDAQFRQQLLSRRAKLECSRDGGSTFTTWTFGYLTALRQTNAMTYEFTVSDSRRLESTHTAFTWWSDTNKTTDERREFPNRGCVMGGPMIENFGPLRASGGWEFFWREVQDNYLALAFRAAYEAPSYSRIPYFTVSRFMYDTRNFLQKLPPIATLTGANYEQLRDREYVFAYPALMAMVSDGTTTWYGSVRAAFTPVSYSGSGAGDRTQGFDISRSNYMYIELDPGQSTSYPSANAVVRVRLLQREVSDVSPIYIDDHPVNIAAKLYATVGIPYSSASVTSTKAAVGDDVRLALRIAEPQKMGEFLSNAIFGPFGFSARTNASGQQEFFPTRIANSTAPSTTIAVNDIVGDTPPPVFEVDEGTVVTSFRLSTQTLTPFIPDPDNTEPPPADGMVFVNNTQVVQNADTSTFSTREIAYDFPGMVHDGSASGIAFVLSTDVVTKFFTSIVAEGFDRFGRGAIASEVQVLANSAAASLQVGDEVVVNIPYYPNKNYRIGESNVGTRIAQIVRRTETPEGPIFKLIDSGVNQQPTSPTFTVAAWSGDPRRVAAVTVTNASTLNSSDITLAVQYQVSATTPTKTGTLFTRFRPGTIPTIAFLLPIAPPGSKVWVRMRTEKTELRASAWTAWTSVTLNAWTAPTSLATSGATANSMILTWSLNGNTADPIDVFAYPGASAPADWTPYRINTFTAGSTTTVVRNLVASTQYTFGVAFRDATTGAYSTFSTATASTAGVNTTSCPAAPKMKIIPSFENAGATTGVVLSIGAIEGYNIVVQRAPDSGGSPGTWVDIAVLLPLTGYYADILPSDGVTRWYRVFYRLSGFLDGAAGTARSATPIAIPDDLVLNEGPSIIAGGATLTLGNYLTGGSYDGSVSVTTNVDATPNNTASKVVARDASGNFSAGTITAALSGNASTTTALETARNINGVSFNGTADITVTAAAGTLTGDTLASGVVNSSLTSVGTIGTGVWQGTSIGKNYGGTGLTSSAFSGITNERVFAYDGGSGAFFVAPSGSNGQALVYSGGALAWGNPAPGSHVLATTTGLGPEHTTSGLTAGMILQATGATTARFQTPSIPASSVTAGTFSGTSYTITNDLTVSGTLTASLPFSSITSKPTTLSGYGITDALSNSTSSTQSGYFGDIFLWDDTNPSHYLQVTNSGDLSAARTLSINVNDASRTVSLSGNLTVSGNADISGTSSGTNTGDQTITLTGAVTGSGTGSFATTYAGTVPIAKGGTNKTSYSTTGTGTRVAVYDQGTGAFDVVSPGSSGQFLQSSGTTGDVQFATPPTFTSSVAGYAPASGGGTSNFLRADGTWAVPAVGSVSANNVTAGTFAGATYTFSNSVTFTSGVRVANGETYKILNSGGTAIDVLSATTLGSGVINSSLTSVGTLTSGALGAGFTAIDNARLANSSITINGSSVSLGGSITVDTSKWTSSGSNIYFNTGNVAIGTTPSASYRLLLRGTGATSATYALGVENSAATNTFYVADNGNVAIPNGTLGIGTSPTTNRLTVNGTSSTTALGVNTVSPSEAVQVDGRVYINGESNGLIVDTGSKRVGFMKYAGHEGVIARVSGVKFGIVRLSSSDIATPGTITYDVYVDPNGNVGIGTTPAVRLDVAGGNIRTTNGYAFAGNASNPGDNAALFYDQSGIGPTINGLNFTVRTGSTTTSEAFRVASTGYVGIGTTPIRGLHLAGTSALAEFILENTAMPADNRKFNLWGEPGVGTSGRFYFRLLNDAGNAATREFLAFDNATGNVGVGVRAPAYKLDVDGTIQTRSGGVRFPDGTTQTTAFSGVNTQWTTSGANIYYTAGNVGIGTASPDYRLTVLTPTSDTTIGFNLRAYATGADGDRTTISRYTSSNNNNWAWHEAHAWAHIWKCNGIEQMRLTSDGNIGIGTTAPRTRLEVNGNIFTTWGTDSFIGMVFQTGSEYRNGIKFNSSARSTGLVARYSDGTGFVWLGAGPNEDERLRVTAAGNVGIGTTSPSYKLDVSGDIGLTNEVYLDNGKYIRFRRSSGGLSIQTLGIESGTDDVRLLTTGDFKILNGSLTQLVTVKNGGNVGIGTTSPAVKLDVTGASGTSAASMRLTNTGTAVGDYAIYQLRQGSSSVWQMFVGANEDTLKFGRSGVGDYLFLASSGNVGIGTSSPSFTLDSWSAGAVISGTATIGSNMRGVRIYNTNTATTNNAVGLWFSTGPHQAGIASFRASAETTWETTLAFYTHVDTTSALNDATEKMRLTGNGYLLVNSATSIGVGDSRLQVGNGSSGGSTQLLLKTTAGHTAIYSTTSSNSYFTWASGGFLGLGNAPADGSSFTEAMRISSGNDVFVGTTTSWSSARFVSERNSTSVPAAEFNGTGQTSGLAPVYIWNNAESGNTYFISCYSDGVNNPRTLRGYLNYRRTTNDLVLTTASDYRIKTIHGPYTKSGEVFDKIQIHDGTMNGATMGHVPMAVAHELAEAVPYAVDGEKDAINEDGTPKLQMVSYASLIPLMLAEIKSLRERVAQLES